MKTLNRRDFLRTSGAAALFAATPGLAYSQVVGGPGPFPDYKALVCVFLFGTAVQILEADGSSPRFLRCGLFVLPGFPTCAVPGTLIRFTA